MSTYSFMDVHCTLTSDDAVIDVGYGAGVAEEGITFGMAGDKNTMTIGADGEGMHSLHADNSGQVTVRLLKTSPTNAKLMNLYNLQKADTRKWGKNTITMNNSSSGDNATATKCAFKKVPDLANAKDGSMLEWVFDSIKVDMKLGTYE
ncbi:MULTISPECIES: phage structural protein [Acinetobacter calcoaceticus/baumannii complex]|uniref:phage structural protein n=1 Tax=Acinetobacter calcoaceticus/baumannii complex TaxID=909768 RepID=UPI003214D9B3